MAHDGDNPHEAPAPPRHGSTAARPPADRSRAAPQRRYRPRRQALHRHRPGPRHRPPRPGWSTPREVCSTSWRERHERSSRSSGCTSVELLHVQGGRRQDRALRHAPQPSQLRPEQEVSTAGERVRRAPPASMEAARRGVHAAQAPSRSMASCWPRSMPAAQLGPRQAVPRRDLQEARPASKSTTRPRVSSRSGTSALRRQDPRGHLRHVLRRLRRDHCLLRHPEVFQAAVACSAVTDWQNYDIDLHRALHVDLRRGTGRATRPAAPDDLRRQAEGPAACSSTARPTTTSTRTTPCNSSRPCSSAGKSFDVQVGPDMGTSAPCDSDRMMEFFCQHLLQR